jgi:hypothetical protein
MSKEVGFGCKTCVDCRETEEPCLIHAIQSVARALHRLGNADAATPFGGLEAIGIQIKEASGRIATAIEGLSDAIGFLAKEGH